MAATVFVVFQEDSLLWGHAINVSSFFQDGLVPTTKYHVYVISRQTP